MPDNPTIANDKLMYRSYVVAVLDILGQKDAIRRLAEVDTVSPSSWQPDVIQALKGSLGRRDAVANAIVDSFRLTCSDTGTKKIAELDAQQRELLSRFPQPEIKTFQFSDMVVAYMPFMTSEREPRVRDLMAMMSACATALLTFISLGLPIRGGVELDYGLEPGNNEIYGPAFLRAYELEQHVAQYPRIVVGMKLVKWIVAASQLEATSQPQRIISALANHCWSLLARDDDGFFFIDYLGDACRRIAVASGHSTALDEALAFAEKEHSRFMEMGNQKLAGRYAALRRYIEARAPAWRSTDSKPKA